MTSTETLRRYGWKPIVSDAQAFQLLRRELKYLRDHQQRNPDLHVSLNYILSIKSGNWYKFHHNPKNQYCSMLIWNGPVKE